LQHLLSFLPYLVARHHDHLKDHVASLITTDEGTLRHPVIDQPSTLKIVTINTATAGTSCLAYGAREAGDEQRCEFLR
jgi:hypothetical protein